MVRKRKSPSSSRKSATPSLETTSLRKGQEFTSKVWARHTSRVTGPDSYSSVITRILLGRSHFNLVACSAAIEVSTEPNNRTVILFLPLSGSMMISLGERSFRAAPRHPMFLPHRTAMRFTATPVECLLMEIPVTALISQMRSHGALDDLLEPMDWPEGGNAESLVRFLDFLTADLMGMKSAPQPHHLKRMEELLLSCLARAIVTDRPTGNLPEAMIGRMRVEELRDWIGGNLTLDLTPAGIAAKAGFTIRSLQKGFLRYFNTTFTSFLLDLRLESVRRELLASRRSGGISEIAMWSHFNHRGRFSQVSRKQFGELPSATLLRRSGKVAGRTIQKKISSRNA